MDGKKNRLRPADSCIGSSNRPWMRCLQKRVPLTQASPSAERMKKERAGIALPQLHSSLGINTSH